MTMSQTYLKWGSHNETLLGILHSYCMKEEMTDTTLHFQDGKINAHRIILSACSSTFERILKERNTSEIYLCHIMKSSMKYLIEFMYRGHVLVPSDALAGVLQAAEYFQVKGIPAGTGSQNSQSQQIVITSNNVQKEQKGLSSVAENRYGPPSSPIRRDRPRPKNPPQNSVVMSPQMPERDKVPFRSTSNISGNTSKSEDMPAGEQSTSGTFYSSVEKTSTLVTSTVTKKESHSKALPREASQIISNSYEHGKSSRKTKTAHTEDNTERSSSKRTRLVNENSKVVNPFAKKATIPESPDSDSTFIGAPKQIKAEEENDVEILVVDDAPIEVMESLIESKNSLRFSDSDDSFDLACAPSKLRLEPYVTRSKNTEAGASTSRRGPRPGDNFSSTDDEVPLSENSKRSKASPKKSPEKKGAKAANEVVIKKPPPDRSKIVSQKKLERHTEDLLNKPLIQMHQFCPMCFKYFEDIKGHIKKRHKKISKKKYPCEVCEKEFFNESFFDYHKCISQEKD